MGSNTLHLPHYIFLSTLLNKLYLWNKCYWGVLFHLSEFVGTKTCFYIVTFKDALLVLFTRDSRVDLALLCLSHADISVKLWWGHVLQDSVVSPINFCHIKVEDDWDGWTSGNMVAGDIVLFSSSLSKIIVLWCPAYDLKMESMDLSWPNHLARKCKKNSLRSFTDKSCAFTVM